MQPIERCGLDCKDRGTYASGDATGAADALREFRATDPDADKYLPDALRSWARTVK